MNTRQLLLTALATLVIFVAGIGTGHRLARTNLLPQPPFRRQAQMAGMPMMGRLDQFARMVRDLDLDPTQRQRIDRLITERQEYLADIIRLLDPELHELMPKLRRDVDEVLRPDQRRELERRFTERVKRENSGTLPEPRRLPPMRDIPSDFRPGGPGQPQRPGPGPNRPPQPGTGQPEP